VLGSREVVRFFGIVHLLVQVARGASLKGLVEVQEQWVDLAIDLKSEVVTECEDTKTAPLGECHSPDNGTIVIRD